MFSIEDKYVVWGTGNYAMHMMEEIENYANDFPIICNRIINQILCFVDSDSEKRGKIFYDKIIKSPVDIDWDKI